MTGDIPHLQRLGNSVEHREADKIQFTFLEGLKASAGKRRPGQVSDSQENNFINGISRPFSLLFSPRRPMIGVDQV